MYMNVYGGYDMRFIAWTNPNESFGWFTFGDVETKIPSVLAGHDTHDFNVKFDSITGVAPGESSKSAFLPLFSLFHLFQLYIVRLIADNGRQKEREIDLFVRMMLGVVALVWLWGFGEFWFAGFGRYFSTPGRSLRGSLPTSPSWIYARPDAETWPRHSHG